MKLELFISSYQWLKKWKGLQFQVFKMKLMDWIESAVYRSNTIDSKVEITRCTFLPHYLLYEDRGLIYINL